MLSKSQLSFVNSLHLKKFRKQHNLFIVEGYKSISEFIASDYVLYQLFHVPEVASKVAIFTRKTKHFEVSSSELGKISTLKNPSGALALFEIPMQVEIKAKELEGNFSLVLDHVQDPGNLGTIIRTADWFGIKHIICSVDTADCYNPKVIQATMGSLARVTLQYTDLAQWLSTTKIKTYGALLNGTSLYDSDLSLKNDFSKKREGIVIMGNEGQGIRSEILPFIDEAITIPNFGEAESLNVAIATALICSEIKRNESLPINGVK